MVSSTSPSISNPSTLYRKYEAGPTQDRHSYVTVVPEFISQESLPAVYPLSLHHIKTIQMTDTHALYLLSSCTNHVPTPRYYTHGPHHLASMVLHPRPPPKCCGLHDSWTTLSLHLASMVLYGVTWGEAVSRVATLKKAALRILEPAS